jgi:hypothetical protein
LAVGKNKPLEVDEVDFLNTVLNAQAERERAVRLLEQQELAAFREVALCLFDTPLSTKSL